MSSRTYYSSNVERTLRVTDELLTILKQSDFSFDLQKDLSKTQPQYQNTLETIQRNILSIEVGIVVGGERCEAKHQLLSKLCGNLITLESYRKMSNANIVIKSGDSLEVSVFKEGERIHDLSCKVENVQMDNHKTIREHLIHVANDVSILQGCNVEILKKDKCKVNATFLDVPADIDGMVYIRDYLELIACFIFVVETSDRSYIQRTKMVVQRIAEKVKITTPFHSDKVIVVQKKRRCETLSPTVYHSRPGTELLPMPITDAITFVNVKNVFNFHFLKDVTQFEDFADRIKRQVLLYEDTDIKKHLQSMRGLTCDAIRSMCGKMLTTANSSAHGEGIMKVSETVSNLQQKYSKVSSESDTHIQDTTEMMKDIMRFFTDLQLEPLDTQSDMEPCQSAAKDDDHLLKIKGHAMNSPYIPKRPMALLKRKRGLLLNRRWNSSTLVGFSQSSDLKNVDQGTSVDLEEKQPNRRVDKRKVVQLVLAFANQLLTIEEIESKLGDGQYKLEVLPHVESSDTKITFEEGQEKLQTVYKSLGRIISSKQYDSILRHELAIICPDYNEVLSRRIEDLKRKDSSIVVAGETNAGKTTLLNSIMGRSILVSHHLSNTGRVCRVRNCQEKGIRLYTKENKLIKEMKFNSSTELKKSLQKYCGKNEDISQEAIYYVDILFPVNILKGDVMIVDTPGMNEEEKVKSMLEEYLPNALAFVFVLNVANDGGVQCDRIPKLLRHIQKLKKDMPCFDEQDVLFLVNKWDTIVIPDLLVDSDDEEEDDQELKKKNEEHRKEQLGSIWTTVLRKIKDVWPLEDDRNAFQVSLAKQVRPTIPDGKGSSDEFNRFIRRLGDMVTKTDNKRMKDHLCFLIEFAHNAERGIKARLRLFELSEEDFQTRINRVKERMSKMEKECKKNADDLKKEIDEAIQCCSDKLLLDKSTDAWKAKALNPPDEVPIMHVFFTDLPTEIPARVTKMIKKYVHSEEFLNKLKQTEKKLKELVTKMQKELAKCDEDLTGDSPETESNSNVPLVVGVVATAPLWIPMFVVVGALCLIGGVVLTPIFIIKAIRDTTGESKREAIDIIYGRCIVNLKEEVIKGLLKEIAEPLKDQIDKCFSKYIPRHLENIAAISKNLEGQLRCLKNNKERFVFLNNTFEGVRKDVNYLRKKINVTSC